MDTFFLVGAPRSGTTLLQRLLDHHPEIAVCPETNLFIQLKRYRLTETIPTPQAYSILLQALAKKLQSFQDPAYQLVIDSLTKDWQYPLASINLLHYFAKQYADCKSKTIVGEKTPEHVFHLPLIRKLCPRAKVVLISRHPLDVITSAYELVKTYGNDVGGTDVELLKLAKLLKRVYLAQRRWEAQYPDQIYSLQYENLVCLPEKTLTPLCHFLGVAYNPAMLEFHKTSLVQAAKQPKRGKKQPFSGVDSAIFQQSIGRYATVLSLAQQRMLRLYWGEAFVASLPYELPKPIARLNWRQWMLLAKYRIFKLLGR